MEACQIIIAGTAQLWYIFTEIVHNAPIVTRITMKLTLTTLMAIIILAGPTRAIAAPEISVDRPVYDFGSISQGEKVEHAFVIRNKGNTPLSIKSVRPSCGCTAITTSASVIAPGKSGEIKASFNSANYSGAVNKTVTIDSNDPKVPSSILNLKGTVIEEIQITPKQDRKSVV